MFDPAQILKPNDRTKDIISVKNRNNPDRLV